MDRRTMIVWLTCFATLAVIFGGFAFSSFERAKVKADASVAKAQEHTKRAEGRHELLDFFGQLKR